MKNKEINFKVRVHYSANGEDDLMDEKPMKDNLFDAIERERQMSNLTSTRIWADWVEVKLDDSTVKHPYWNPPQWALHHQYPLDDWRMEIENGYTRLGYVEWVNHLIGVEKEEEEQAVKPKTYNHTFTLAFSVSGCTDPEGEGITAEEYRSALEKRMDDLDSEGDLVWEEALGAPEDTYEED